MGFFIAHYAGIRTRGIKNYLKGYAEPFFFMIPLNIIGELANVVSISFRLFGNMMGHEIVLSILFGLAGAFFAPLPIMALGIFVSFVQGFVFFLLSVIYFTGAMEHAH